MADIKAFKALRPALKHAEKLASKPYDVLNTAEARLEAEGKPESFLHIIRSEIDLPEGTDPHSDIVYETARQNVKSFLDKGFLIREDEDCYYAYRQEMNGHIQTGLVVCCSVQDYFDDVIKKHEFTRPVKEKDRITHIKTTRIQSGPVFSTYPGVAEIDVLVESECSREPLYDFSAPDGVKHTVWRIADSNTVAQLTSFFKDKVPAIYIADGHHRAASSAKVGKALAEENPNHSGNEEYNWFLSVLFPADQLAIIDYNRVVQDLNGYTKADFLGAVSEKFEVATSEEAVKPTDFHEFGMYLDGDWYELSAKEGTYPKDDPVNSLDVAILQDNLLKPILDIDDPRTNERIDFVGGIRGLGELEKRVNSGDMEVAFSLYPVSIDQLIRIADSGNVMPPKSTWFEPKLRSGLIIHSIED